MTDRFTDTHSHTRAATKTIRQCGSARLTSWAHPAALVLALAAGGASVVLGCGWFGTERSVRFHPYVTERQMSRLPPLDFASGDDDPNGSRDERGSQAIEDYEAAQEASRHRTSRARDLWRSADEAEKRGDMDRARAALQEFLRATEEVNPYDWTYPERGDTYSTAELQSARSSALDRLDALDAGASPALVQAYLAARAGYDGRNEEASPPVEVNAAAPTSTPTFRFNTIFGVPPPPPPPPKPTPQHVPSTEEAALGTHAARALEAAAADRRLRDNCDYLRAAIRYRNGEFADAARRFGQVADLRPASEKRDAARFMAGLSWMKLSRSYGGAGNSAVGTPVCPDCHDEAWLQARDAFTALVRAESPRFIAEAHGWLAYLNLRVGRTGEGLAEYYRLLARPDAGAMRLTALTSLSMARPAASPADMEEVGRRLADEPAAALAYLYHDIYNYALTSNLSVPAEVDPYYQNSYSGSDTSLPWREYYRERRAESRRETAEREEMRRLAGYAAEMMKRHPRTTLGGDFAVRLAEINLEIGDYRTALDFTRRALNLGVAGDLRAEALWVAGVAEHRAGELDPARRTLSRLVAEFPRHRLTEGARRYLAMAAEDAGDLDAALEQYLALDYEPDVAYFADVLMSPEQLRSFIERHPRHERTNELWYALGVRHLRAGRWAEAREAYARVNPVAGLSYWNTYALRHDEHATRPALSKLTSYDEPPRVVEAEWIQRDLQTIETLEGFERQLAEAPDDEARAETLYQTASYFYQGSELVFYNPSLWRVGRYHNLTHLFTSDGFRAPGEVTKFWQHMREHSDLTRALEIYLRVAREYPRTRAAPDALYTAAVAYEKLESIGSYSELYETEFYKQTQVVTYADVRRLYPRYQLPRGTFGWEPATRTVNGKAGFTPKPKPAPRLSKFERGRQKAAVMYAVATGYAADVWRDMIRPSIIAVGQWLMIGFMLAGSLIVGRAAARTRRLWRARAGRRASGELRARGERGFNRHRKFRRRARRALGWRHLEVRDAVRLKLIASGRFLVRRGRQALPRLAARVWQAVTDTRERRLVALNVLTHGALALLLAGLFRLLY